MYVLVNFKIWFKTKLIDFITFYLWTKALPENPFNCRFDLKLGLEKFIPHIPHQHGIDTLLEWVVQNKTRLMANPSVNPIQKFAYFFSLGNYSPKFVYCNMSLQFRPFKADFICWRGLVGALANAPYENFKDMMFGVILYKGTYYMCEIETDAQKYERENMNEKGKSFTYWGHKFETYITSGIFICKYILILNVRLFVNV